MDENNLEITKELDSLESLENTNSITNAEEEIKDMTEKMDSIQETVESIDKLSEEIKDVKEKKKLGKKIKDWWKSLTKKKKVAFIVCGILLLLLLILGIFFLIRNGDKKQEPKKEKEVILEADNYRYENGFLIFLNDKKEELGKYECQNKDENTCFVAYNDIDKTLDVSKKIDEDGNLLNTRSSILLDNYVFIHDTEKENQTLLYDIKEKKVLEEYNGVKTIVGVKDYAIVRNYADSYGLLQFKSEEVLTKIDFNYDYLAMHTEGKTENDKLIANQEGRNYLIDLDEKIVSKAVAGTIVNYNEKYLVTVDEENNYYLYDYNNKQIFDESYAYIRLFDDFALLVKEKEIYFKDYQKNKLNEVGIAFEKKYDYYQKLLIYDKENKLQDTYEAFAVTNNGSTITVTIDETTTVINKEEGRISATTSFINYFGGILYIYNNAEKTNLVGQYKCTNANVITSDSATLESCFIASDKGNVDNDMTLTTSSGMIPILNNRYVFIKDNPKAVSEANTNIVLYDLKAKKIMSKYNSVNTNLNTNLDKPSYVTEANIQIIAKNQNSKYGVISIANDNLSSLIKFEYNSIENIGNYYLASDNNGYSLFDKNGKEITKKVKNKIRGYNAKYLKVYENNGYQIYDYEANKITNTNFKYIELYDNYFAGIDASNKLNLYAYASASTKILENDIQLSSDNYYKEGQRAFKIEIVGTTANIHVLNNGVYTDGTYSLIKQEEPQQQEEQKVEEQKTEESE